MNGTSTETDNGRGQKVSHGTLPEPQDKTKRRQKLDTSSTGRMECNQKNIQNNSKAGCHGLPMNIVTESEPRHKNDSKKAYRREGLVLASCLGLLPVSSPALPFLASKFSFNLFPASPSSSLPSLEHEFTASFQCGG